MLPFGALCFSRLLEVSAKEDLHVIWEEVLRDAEVGNVVNNGHAPFVGIVIDLARPGGKIMDEMDLLDMPLHFRGVAFNHGG